MLECLFITVLSLITIISATAIGLNISLLIDFRRPWLSLDNGKEQYYLKYEGRFLLELGKSLDTLSTVAMTQAVTETLKHTALQSK